jgi:hypothetical protein
MKLLKKDDEYEISSPSHNYPAPVMKRNKMMRDSMNGRNSDLSNLEMKKIIAENS